MAYFSAKRYTIHSNPTRVVSGHIRSYDVDNGIITITFKSGASLRYTVLANIDDPLEQISYFEQEEYDQFIEFLQTECPNED
jgi:hypothetical protein